MYQGGRCDISNAFYPCNGDPTCIRNSDVARHLADGLSIVLRRLRSAAPSAQIVLLLPPDGAIRDYPADDAYWAGCVNEMRTIATATHVQVADAYSAITTAGKTCQYTFLCDDALPDTHPTDAGYALIAKLMFRAAGYVKRTNVG